MAELIKSYEDLEVWKLGVELSLRCYGIAGQLPPSQKYELSSQMRRCAVSIPANIAEGHARRQPKPFLFHVNIALGSLAEWATYLVVAERLHFIEQEAEAFPEGAIPIIIQQQTRAFDCRVAFAELCEAKLCGRPVVVREVEASPGYGRAHHIVP